MKLEDSERAMLLVSRGGHCGKAELVLEKFSEKNIKIQEALNKTSRTIAQDLKEDSIPIVQQLFGQASATIHWNILKSLVNV